MGGGVGEAVRGLNHAAGQQVGFHFIAADVGEHVAVDLDAGAHLLAALLDHFLALEGVVDDVSIFKRQFIFTEDGANTLAPATGGFQVSYNIWFSHKSALLLHTATVPTTFKFDFRPWVWSPCSIKTLHNILICPDKFKGTLSAQAAARAIAAGWWSVRPRDRLRLLPMSDGGDGFGEVMGKILKAPTRRVRAVDAAHRACNATWWSSKEVAIIESARVIGLAMLPAGRFHPFELDTNGLAAVLRRVAASGSRRCLIGIGGSATNDGGFGLARALGWRFLDARGGEIECWVDLGRLRSLRPPEAGVALPEITVAVDVQNPLLGPKGATRVYGPQKGLRGEEFEKAESCLKQLALVVGEHLGRDYSKAPGAGAAGGLGFGLQAFLGARLEPGFHVFARQSGLEPLLEWADGVVTGEGKIDRSTLMGKGVGEVALSCVRVGIPCLGLAGVVEVDNRQAVFAKLGALTQCTSAEKATQRAGYWLKKLAAQMAREGFP